MGLVIPSGMVTCVNRVLCFDWMRLQGKNETWRMSPDDATARIQKSLSIYVDPGQLQYMDAEFRSPVPNIKISLFISEDGPEQKKFSPTLKILGLVSSFESY